MYDRVLVLSDLHMAPASDLLEFHSHRALASSIRTFADGSGVGLLVLNGDTFDYLQLTGYDALSLPLARQRTEALLDGVSAKHPGRGPGQKHPVGGPGQKHPVGGAVEKDPVGAPVENASEEDVVGALVEVLDGGHHLLVVPGNHDPELALHDAQMAVRDRLGGGKERLRFHVRDEPWSVRVGERLVVGAHGCASDPWNAIAPSRLLEAQSRGDTRATLPPGSRLVLEVLNPYRRAKDEQGRRRFPFLDLMKPDLAVVLLLLYLDPGLFLERLEGTLGPITALLIEGIGRLLTGPDRTLGQAASPPEEHAAAGTLASALVDALDPGERAAASRVLAEVRSYLAEGSLRTIAGRLGPGGATRRWLLRAFCRQLGNGETFFDLRHQDPLYEAALPFLPDEAGSVLLTGHTHAARRLEVEGSRLYLNTGTWQDLMAPPERLDEATVAAWLEDLRAGRMERRRRLTAALITEGAAELVEYREDESRFVAVA